jgi:hypothetical protein
MPVPRAVIRVAISWLGDGLVEAGFFDVEDLALEGQDGLEFAVAALLGGAAGGVTLDQVELAQGGVLFLAVGELAGQADAVEHALAPGHLARFARGFPGAGGFDDLAADGLGVDRAFLQEFGEFGGDDFFDRRAGLAGDQLHLGLRCKLGVGHFDGEHTGEAFAHVIAGDFDFRLFGDLVFVDVFVDDPRHRGAQAGEVGAAIGLGNVVGEAQHLFLVGVVPLHRHFDGEFDVLHLAGGDQRRAFGVEHIGMQHGLGTVDVFDEAFDTTGEGEVFFLAVALVDEADLDAVVEEGKFAQALGEDLVMKFDGAENFLIGQEVDFGAVVVGFAQDFCRADFDTVDDLFDDAVGDVALVELEEVFLAVAADGEAQPFRQGIDAGNAHAMESTRDFVGVLVEFAAGMQDAHDDFGSGALGFVLVIHLDADRDATAVVADGDGVVGVDGDDDVVAVAGQGFVDGVVDNFEHHVVQASAIGGVADVHAGALAHGFQAFELLDRGFVISAVGGRGFLRHGLPI